MPWNWQRRSIRLAASLSLRAPPRRCCGALRAASTGSAMITRWYIEAREDESWRHVSDLFTDWLKKNASLKTFGFSEGDAVEYAGKRLYNFDFPARYGESISLFKTWAESTGRLFGGDEGGTVRLSNHQILTLPPRAS